VLANNGGGMVIPEISTKIGDTDGEDANRDGIPDGDGDIDEQDGGRIYSLKASTSIFARVHANVIDEMVAENGQIGVRGLADNTVIDVELRLRKLSAALGLSTEIIVGDENGVRDAILDELSVFGGPIDAGIEVYGNLQSVTAERGTTSSGTITVHADANGDGGDLGARIRYRRNGRRRWRVVGFNSGGDVAGAINVDGNAWLFETDGQLQAPLTIGGAAERIVLEQGASANGDISITGALTYLEAGGTSAYAGDITAGSIGEARINSTGGLEGAILTVQRGDLNGDGDAEDPGETGSITKLHLENGTAAGSTITTQGDLGGWERYKRRGVRRWRLVGFTSDGNVAGAINVAGSAGLIDIGGQLQAALTIGGSADRIVIDQGSSTAGDVTVGLNLTYFEAGGTTFAGDLTAGSIDAAYINSTNGLASAIRTVKSDQNADGDTDDAGETGSINKLHVQNGTAAGSSITVEGDLGGRERYRRRGRRRWRTVGFWSGDDVAGTIDVDGNARLIEIDGQLQAAMTIDGSAEWIAIDEGSSAAGDITVGLDLTYLEAGGTTFEGDLTAGSIDAAYINSTNGLASAVRTIQADQNADGDTDDAGETGSIKKLHVQNGTAAGSTITVDGDLGGRERYRRRGRRRWRTVGFWSGADANVAGDITVTGGAYLIDIDGNLVNADIVFMPLDPAVRTTSIEISGEYQWTNAPTAPEIRGTDDTREFTVTIEGGGNRNTDELEDKNGTDQNSVSDATVTDEDTTWLYWDTNVKAVWLD